MCTQARSPSASSRTESASSKSFAVSGSIVKARRSRRSVRPSIDASGGSYGSKPCRNPRSTISPSRTAWTSSTRPRTDSTRARPRPRTSTARSPGSASPSPLRSTSSGTPGVKTGSPTTCLPRRASSTTTRSVRSDLEEAAQRQHGRGRTEQQPEADQDQAVQREGKRVHPLVLEPDRRDDGLLADEEENHREDRSDQSGEQPFQHERATHEPVGGAYELHHLDLSSPRED